MKRRGKTKGRKRSSKVLTVWRGFGEDEGINFLWERAHGEKQFPSCDPISPIKGFRAVTEKRLRKILAHGGYFPAMVEGVRARLQRVLPPGAGRVQTRAGAFEERTTSSRSTMILQQSLRLTK
jgi:hypothetical protein